MTLSSGAKALIVIAAVMVAALCVTLIVTNEDGDGGWWHQRNAPQHTITLTKSDGGSVTGAGTYREGNTVTLTATPSSGYYFVGWYKGSSLYSTQSNMTFKAQESLSLNAKFDHLIHTVNVSVSNANAGTLSTTGGQIAHGNVFTCSVSPKVAGYTFDGWFSGSTLMSKFQTYTFTVNSDVMLVARYSITHDASFGVTSTNAVPPLTLTLSSTYNVEISQRNWAVQDVLTGESLYNTTAYGSSYNVLSFNVTKGRALSITQTITYSDGQKATSNTVKVVDETVSKHFSWRYQGDAWYSIITDFFNINNRSVTWDVPMSFAGYYGAKTSSLPRSDGYTQIGSYVTSSDPMIRSIAASLMSYTSGWSDIDRVNFVLKFVQSIPYEYDYGAKGRGDYWKLPLEILWEGKGDCEDHAFLFASLIKAMGYSVVLHYIHCYENGKLTGAHIAAGVAVSGGSGYYTALNNVKYYYCEATATSSAGWFDYADVGYRPSGYTIMNTYKV